MEDAKNRFWIRMNGRCFGPFLPDEAARFPSVQKNGLLCPDGRDRQDRRNWRLASSFPEVQAVMANRM